jgi:hypothetical protein
LGSSKRCEIADFRCVFAFCDCRRACGAGGDCDDLRWRCALLDGDRSSSGSSVEGLWVENKNAGQFDLAGWTVECVMRSDSHFAISHGTRHSIHRQS